MSELSTISFAPIDDVDYEAIIRRQNNNSHLLELYFKGVLIVEKPFRAYAAAKAGAQVGSLAHIVGRAELELYKRVLDYQETLGELTAEQVTGYLERTGWKLTASYEGMTLWRITFSADLVDVMVPSRTTYDDYSRRVEDVLNNMAIVESRDMRHVLLDMLREVPS